MTIHDTRPNRCCMNSGADLERRSLVLCGLGSDVAAKDAPGPIWVVKSQIHAGGRGKGKFKEASAGTRSVCASPSPVAEVMNSPTDAAPRWCTVQTGPNGKQSTALRGKAPTSTRSFNLSILV